MPTAPILAPERDQSFKQGRPKAGATEYLMVPGASLRLASTVAPTAGTDYYCPFYVDTPLVVDRLVAEVSTLDAADNFRMGLYRADADYQPIGAPLADSGDISTATTGVKTYTPGTTIYLTRGRYLTVLNQSAAAIFRSVIGQMPATPLISTLSNTCISELWRVTRAYAAFPTPGTAWTTTTEIGSGGLDWFVFLRVKTP